MTSTTIYQWQNVYEERRIMQFQTQTLYSLYQTTNRICRVKKTLNYNNILSCFKITLNSGVLLDEANDVQSYESNVASVVVPNTMLTNGWWQQGARNKVCWILFGGCLVYRSLAITSWIFIISTLMSLLCTLKKKRKEIMIKLFPSFNFWGKI